MASCLLVANWNKFWYGRLVAYAKYFSPRVPSVTTGVARSQLKCSYVSPPCETKFVKPLPFKTIHLKLKLLNYGFLVKFEYGVWLRLVACAKYYVCFQVQFTGTSHLILYRKYWPKSQCWLPCSSLRMKIYSLLTTPLYRKYWPKSQCWLPCSSLRMKIYSLLKTPSENI
jgi:hypothetical protein